MAQIIFGREVFQPLLKPIPDITKLEIDLAESLEGYLSYILSIDLNPGSFVEAALLVQNSVAIYSKKVDILWNVVLQLVEALRKSKPKCSLCGGYECETSCQRRKGKLRANESKNSEDLAVDKESEGARKKRANHGHIATDDLLLIDEICSDRLLNFKDKKGIENNLDNTKIVLNAATKVKTEHNVACSIYDSEGEVIGKKDEFRLHWRISSNGTLVEDFVNSHCTSKRTFGIVEDSDCDMAVDTSFPPADDDFAPPCNNDDSAVNNNEILPASMEKSEDVPITDFITKEDEFRRYAEKNILREKKAHVISLDDIKEKAWEPIVFDVSMPEKVTRRKNTVKVPETLQEQTKPTRKRKRTDIEINVNSFLTLYDLVENRLKAYKINKYLHTYELLRLIQAENQLKKEVLLRRRKAYQELVIREASKEFEGEFEGFPDMDPECDDDDGGGFNGFVDNDNDNYVADELNVPLPQTPPDTQSDNVIDNHKDVEELETNTYQEEALKMLHEYQMKAKNDQQLLAENMGERVAAWHQLIKPRLEEAERKRHFDIHEYGTRILDKLTEGSTSKNPERPFSEIVAGHPKGEVARMFLTTLCLANTYNVELSKTDKSKLAMDCLHVKFLSRVRHHEEMHDMIENTKS